MAKIASPDGLAADLTDASTGLTFSQAYTEDCNPLRDDYSVCWFVENYKAGDAGLTGHVSLRSTQTQAISDIDITWEGYTDRYGNGSNYYYKHGTLTGFTAPIVDTLTQPVQP